MSECRPVWEFLSLWPAWVSPACGDSGWAGGTPATGSALVWHFALGGVMGEDTEALKETLSLWETTRAVTPPDFYSTVNSARIQGGASFQITIWLMDKEVMDECNMCHPQMKAPTLATPGCSPTFVRSFQSKVFVGQKLMLCFLFRSQALNNSGASANQIIPKVPKRRKAEDYLTASDINVGSLFKQHGFGIKMSNKKKKIMYWQTLFQLHP